MRRIPDRLHGRLRAAGHLPLPTRLAGMGLHVAGLPEHGYRLGGRRVFERDHRYHRAMPAPAAAVAVTRNAREAVGADGDIPPGRVRVYRERHPSREIGRPIFFLHRRELRLRHHYHLVHGRGRGRDLVRLLADIATHHQVLLFAHARE